MKSIAFLALLALSGCNSAPRPTTPPPSHSRTLSVPLTNAPDRSPAMRLRTFSVAYTPAGAVVVTSSYPPTVEQLPSGLYRVSFTQTQPSAGK